MIRKGRCLGLSGSRVRGEAVRAGCKRNDKRTLDLPLQTGTKKALDVSLRAENVFFCTMGVHMGRKESKF